jgi:hypothetical protein
MYSQKKKASHINTTAKCEHSSSSGHQRACASAGCRSRSAAAAASTTAAAANAASGAVAARANASAGSPPTAAHRLRCRHEPSDTAIGGRME